MLADVLKSMAGGVKIGLADPGVGIDGFVYVTPLDRFYTHDIDVLCERLNAVPE